jgi:hypothetical protein
MAGRQAALIFLSTGSNRSGVPPLYTIEQFGYELDSRSKPIKKI